MHSVLCARGRGGGRAASCVTVRPSRLFCIPFVVLSNCARLIISFPSRLRALNVKNPRAEQQQHGCGVITRRGEYSLLRPPPTASTPRPPRRVVPRLVCASDIVLTLVE